MKKLKYHQYIPPDQKQEASESPMDSAYARLLQQQQLFLQLQILSHQQQQHYNYQTILPAPLKYVWLLLYPLSLYSYAVPLKTQVLVRSTTSSDRRHQILAFSKGDLCRY